MAAAPDGRSAIVVAERLQRLDFRNPHTFRLQHALTVPCSGVNHMDFTANGSFAVVSCEFSGQLLLIDLVRRRVTATLRLPRRYAILQDVRVSPDGRVFYVADLAAGGVWEIGLAARRLRVLGFLRTGAGAHGLVVSRDGQLLYVANRNAGSVSVISFARRSVIRTWRIPHGSPDMGGVSADGSVLWLSGRYNAEVCAINTRTGGSSPGSRSEPVATASAFGRSPAATRSATPLTSAEAVLVRSALHVASLPDR